VDNEEVRVLLQRFQDGYSQRDLATLESFLELFVNTDDLEVIGTNAVEPGRGEWCRGRAAVRQLVKSDWEGWGDVVLDVKGAHICVRGDVAWLSARGTLTDTAAIDEGMGGYLGLMEGMLGEDTISSQSKMLEIMQLGSELQSGPLPHESRVYPLRFAAVVVRLGERWVFNQVVFSFPTARGPDLRYD